MFKSEKQNYHHSKLPVLGSIGYLVKGHEKYSNNPIYLTEKKEKVKVIAFPLCDNVLPYSKGIHTCYVELLGCHKIIKVSGFWFEDEI